MSLATCILSKACGYDVVPGEFVEVSADIALGHDVTSPIAIKEMEQIAEKVWERDKVVICMDHFVPAPNVNTAKQQKFIREWARKQELKYFFDAGCGVCHQILIDKGIAKPGTVLVGADSHTCSSGAMGCLSISIGSTELGVVMATGKIWLMVPETILINVKGAMPAWTTGKDLALHLLGVLADFNSDYKVIEFAGEGIGKLSISDRITICNMMAESGAKAALFAPDEEVYSFLRGKNVNFETVHSDGKAEYEIDLDLSKIEPMISVPFSPTNVKPITEIERLTIDQAHLGSCTNGRLEDLTAAASILKGKKINDNVRFLVSPASREVFQKALKEGTIDILVEAGAQIVGWSCGACFGGHLGILAEGERCIASTNRNFPGRMGHVGSEVYLSSPYTVAASALTGKITDPRSLT